MRTLFFIPAFLTLVALLSSCEVKPQPIAYGDVNCQHCQMTVTDKRYGAETVLKTGKAYYFDSIECMVAYLQEKPEEKEKTSLQLVTDFNQPGHLLNAEEAAYLQSKNLPSPMGMFLTAFNTKNDTEKMQQNNGGRVLNWQDVNTVVSNNERP
ncbi:MAG: nitrous oxide reductase accessory protein NosL [Hymenobacteraceae bacterium]|nr:nitrous oxide reductase accessory protein NosL [Hymenobacteraceae bacterium]